MKIEYIKELEIPDVKIIRYTKFTDKRGYFSETFNWIDFKKNSSFFDNYEVKQINESFSLKKTLRGLHFQKMTPVGKLLRVILGKIVDFALDIRPDSPSFKKIIAVELQPTANNNDWIWIPPNFAHGFLALKDSTVEYFCTEYYNVDDDYSISFFDKEIDWSLCSASIIEQFKLFERTDFIMSEKDANASDIKLKKIIKY